MLEEVISRGKNCLLVKLLTYIYYNWDAFKATTRNVWWPAKPLYFHEMGPGLMLTEFKNLNDKTRVVWDGPWHFKKCLILVKEFDGAQQVKNISLHEASFWVRIHDLPLMAITIMWGTR